MQRPCRNCGKEECPDISFILRGYIQCCPRAALLTQSQPVTVHGWFSVCSVPTNASTDAPTLNRKFPVPCSRLRVVCSPAEPWPCLSAPWALPALGERWLWGRRAILGSFGVISCDKAAISLIGMIPNKPLNTVLCNLQAPKEGSLPPLQLPEQPWHFTYKSFEVLQFTFPDDTDNIPGLYHSAVLPASYAGCW